MRVLVTGSRGFIGRNLTVRLGELPHVTVLPFDRGMPEDALAGAVADADSIVHLAGENRPADPSQFERTNAGLTRTLCGLVRRAGRRIPIVLASSIQAASGSPYGESKRLAEETVQTLAEETGNPAVIFRLPNVFGKWCRPNYNSVVATFCHNIAHDLPVRIDAAGARLRLVHVDDVVSEFLRVLGAGADAGATVAGVQAGEVSPEFSITLGELAAQIEAFKNCRENLVIERVGTGLVRALYSTYVSHLPPARFAYALPRYRDPRGDFVEMLKTTDSGQFSYFTAAPGVTRGGHYHHCKTEKFLVIRGSARFKFRHIITDETHQITVSGEQPQVVETVPGWTHDITNTGADELIVMLWANEIFDRSRPDTVTAGV